MGNKNADDFDFLLPYLAITDRGVELLFRLHCGGLMNLEEGHLSYTMFFGQVNHVPSHFFAMRCYPFTSDGMVYL